MSGPVSKRDVPDEPEAAKPATSPVLELSPSREATVGVTTVRRALPQRPRRTVGAWCFADHFGPAGPGRSMAIGPHPHIGLQTVTWLMAGELLHRDSLGSEQLIRAGQLNLMTAGRGVAHAEEHPPSYDGAMHGVQLWVAQPESTRHGSAAFEHHADLPQVDIGAGFATVLLGGYAGALSAARTDTPIVGVVLELAAGSAELPLHRAFEHAFVVTEGALHLADRVAPPGVLAYVGQGRDNIDIRVREPTRALLLGGEPFPDHVLMWWNFVARTRDEVDLATKEWNAESERFGIVPSVLERLAAPPTPWRTA
ncbi:MAG: pirin family protein [Actinomycetes bacterium]